MNTKPLLTAENNDIFRLFREDGTLQLLLFNLVLPMIALLYYVHTKALGTPLLWTEFFSRPFSLASALFFIQIVSAGSTISYLLGRPRWFIRALVSATVFMLIAYVISFP